VRHPLAHTAQSPDPAQATRADHQQRGVIASSQQRHHRITLIATNLAEPVDLRIGRTRRRASCGDQLQLRTDPLSQPLRDPHRLQRQRRAIDTHHDPRRKRSGRPASAGDQNRTMRAMHYGSSNATGKDARNPPDAMTTDREQRRPIVLGRREQARDRLRLHHPPVHSSPTGHAARCLQHRGGPTTQRQHTLRMGTRRHHGHRHEHELTPRIGQQQRLPDRLLTSR
jgi:hypothetical protein